MTLDRTSLPEVTEKVDQNRIHGWNLRTALAIGIVLGSSELSTYEPCSPTTAIAAQNAPEAVPTPHEFLRRSLQETAGVSDVIFEENRVQFRFNDQELSGNLSDLHQIASLTFRGALITFHRPIDTKTIDPVLHNIDRALSHIARQHELDGLSIESPDGVRFLFTVDNDGNRMRYVATGEDLLQIVREPTEEEQNAWKEAAIELAQFRKNIRQRLETAVPKTQRQEMTLREKRLWIRDRIRAIDAVIQSAIDSYREHPYQRIERERWKADFHEEIDTLWRTCQRSPDNIGSSTFESTLDALDEELGDDEEYYFSHPRDDWHFTPAEQLDVLERIERCDAVNTRYDAARNELWKHYLESPRGSRSEQYWWNRFYSLDREFLDGVNAFNRDQGWERWDSFSLSPERYNEVLQNLDTLLSRYEDEVAVTPEKRDGTIKSAFLREQEEFRSLARIEEEARTRASRTELSDASGRRITEVQDPLFPCHFYREERTQMGRTIDRYEEGYRYGRSIYEGTEYVAYLSFTPRGSPKFRNDWEAVQLVRQTWYRADGTQEWVSDRDTDRVDYYAENGILLARLEYEDGGARITRVSFHGNDGETFSTFDREREERPDLTKDEYIALLAKYLDTPQKLHAFLDIFMQYTNDDGEYWQSAQETVERVIGGRMRGDCDDYAFLAREILRKQGKNAHAVFIPGHAICLWVEIREDGRYDVSTIGTFGYDRNGNSYGAEGNPAWNDGFADLEEGFNAVMRKYDLYIMYLEENEYYRIDPNVIWTMPHPRAGTYEAVNIWYFLQSVR